MSLVFHHDHPLKTLNTFGMNVRAATFCELDDLARLPELLASEPYRRGPVLWLGGGSNLLFTGNYPGLVVKVALSGITVLSENDDEVVVEAAAGENWHGFVQHTLAQGWAGLENLSLIPGTVGASPIQNIGAYGIEVKDCLTEVVCADLHDNGALRILSNAECRFGYRDSVFKHEMNGRLLVTAVRYRLSKRPTLHTGYGDIGKELAAMGKADGASPRDVSEAVIRIRTAKLPDPAQLGNAGSFFKNPIIDTGLAEALLAHHPDLPHYPAGTGKTKLAAGWLIDRAGLKGYREGDAGVHARQALVLVNYGHASGKEVWALAQKVQATVKERYGVELEPEPLVL